MTVIQGNSSSKLYVSLGERRTNPGRQVDRTTDFCAVKVKTHYNIPWGRRGGIEGQLYFFYIKIGAELVWVANAMPRPLCPRERDPVPIVQESQWVYTGAEYLALIAIRSPERPARRQSILCAVCTVASNICGFSVCDLRHVTFLAPKIVGWFLDFCKTCAPPDYGLCHTWHLIYKAAFYTSTGINFQTSQVCPN